MNGSDCSSPRSAASRWRVANRSRASTRWSSNSRSRPCIQSGRTRISGPDETAVRATCPTASTASPRPASDPRNSRFVNASGDELRIARPFGQGERPASVRLCSGQTRGRVQTPGQALLDLDLGGHIIAQLVESQLERDGTRLESLDVGDDPPEPNQRSGAGRPGRRGTGDVLQHDPGARHLAGLEQAISGLQPPFPRHGRLVRRGETGCCFPQLGCGVRRVACPGPQRSCVEGRGDLRVGAFSGGRKVPAALLDILHDLRQAGVEAPPVER